MTRVNEREDIVAVVARMPSSGSLSDPAVSFARVRKVMSAASSPGLPENSLQLRIAAAFSVIVGIAACRSAGEIGVLAAVLSIAGVAAGGTFSHLKRNRPWRFATPVLALAAIGVFAWFFYAITAAVSANGGAGLNLLDDPLALLFVWIQVIHSFDLPSRRDLAFSIAGSGTLIAVSATQDLSASFAVYVTLWAILCAWGLSVNWSSMVGAPNAPIATGISVAIVALGVAMVVLAVLPPLYAHTPAFFPFSFSPGGSGSKTGGHSLSSSPANSEGGQARANSRLGVGGFLGFAGQLNTAIREPFSKKVVMYVRATRPSFWAAETYSHWSGRSWTSKPVKQRRLQVRRLPITLPPLESNVPLFSLETASTVTDIQEFTLAGMKANLIFAAEKPIEVWPPGRSVVLGSGGTISSPVTMGPGTVYTVVSQLNNPTPRALRSAQGNGPTLAPADASTYTQLPARYRRVRELALSLTKDHKNLYSKVLALENWMAHHLHYSTSIPALPPGQDAVNAFLFGNRTGYCEQISTALAVMLRTLGVPAREAVGYVPGSYDPLTHVYSVTAADAHAWVQVWFPGIGWESFDPTARVPKTTPGPASQLLSELASVSHDTPLMVAFGALIVLVVFSELSKRGPRRKKRTWAETMSRKIERAGQRAGIARNPGETIGEYARRLDSAESSISTEGKSRPSNQVEPTSARATRGRGPQFEELATAIAQDAYDRVPLDARGKAKVASDLARLTHMHTKARVKKAVRATARPFRLGRDPEHV